MKLIGVGTDVIEVSRIKDAMSDENFLTRILSPREKEFLDSKNANAQTIAGRFAAKEAISKALGTGFRGDITASNIEIINNELGKPVVKLLTDEYPDVLFQLSIAHIDEIAMACAVAYKED